MKVSTLLIRTTTAILMGAVFCVAISGSASARQNSVGGTYTTGRGATGAYSASVAGRPSTGVTRQQSITTQNGKTYNRSATNTFNKSTDTLSRSVTGPAGHTRDGSVTFTSSN